MAYPRNPEGTSEMVPFRLTPKLKASLKIRAKEQGKTVSAYVASVVERDLSARGIEIKQTPSTPAPQATTPQRALATIRTVDPVSGEVEEGPASSLFC